MLEILITIELDMKQKLITSVLLTVITVSSAFAADFFDTDKCDNLLSFGARIGVNTSNRTMSNESFPAAYHHESWGTGFDIGVVANLNIRQYLAIQPGFFFESRNGDYALMGDPAGSGIGTSGVAVAQAGSRSSYNFTIPVLAVVRFNPLDEVQWNVEAGPYFTFLLDSKMQNKALMQDGIAEPQPLFNRDPSNVDFGFKMGTSLQLFDHYYIGVHYMAGCLHAWKDYNYGNNVTKSFGGVTKAWTFTIGYDF